MNRLTTDNPTSNIETMLNYAYAKDSRVILRYGDGETILTCANTYWPDSGR